MTPRASVALFSVYRTINGIKITPKELQKFLCLLRSSLVWVKHSKERLALPQDLNGTLAQNNNVGGRNKPKTFLLVQVRGRQFSDSLLAHLLTEKPHL